MNPAANLGPVLAALPPQCRQRLVLMGWPGGPVAGSDPDRALRRAIGGAELVSLVDLELDPERWHGAYVSTHGTVGWSKETTCMGRLWLNPALFQKASGRREVHHPPLFQARVSGIILADAAVRAEHRQKHHCPGGYGRFGLFIAELVAASVQIDVHAPSGHSSQKTWKP